MSIITANIVRTTRISAFVSVAGFGRDFRCIFPEAVRDLGNGSVEVSATDYANMIANARGLASVDPVRGGAALSALRAA